MAACMDCRSSVSALRRNAAPVTRRRGKPWLLVFLAIAGFLVLTGCGSSTATAAASVSPVAPALKLALGTLDLEGTDQAVDATAAAQLLPLWQLLDELNTSGSAAPAEITVVIEQIEATMTASQLNAIAALKLTDSDVAKASQDDVSAAAGSTTGDSSALAPSAAGMILAGEMGAAGMPPDGGPVRAAASQQNSATSKTSSVEGSLSLIKQVIQLLEKKLQS